MKKTPTYNVLTPERALEKAGVKAPGVSDKIHVHITHNVPSGYTLYVPATQNNVDSTLYYTPDGLTLGTIVPVVELENDCEVATLVKRTTVPIRDFLMNYPGLLGEERFVDLFIDLMVATITKVEIDGSLAELATKVAGSDVIFNPSGNDCITLDLGALNLGIPHVEYYPPNPARPPRNLFLPSTVLPKLWRTLACCLVEGNTSVVGWVTTIIRAVDAKANTVTMMEQEGYAEGEHFACIKATGGWLHTVSITELKTVIDEAYTKIGVMEEKHIAALTRNSKTEPNVRERVPIHVYPDDRTPTQVLSVQAGPDKGDHVKPLTQSEADMEYPLTEGDYEPGVYWVQRAKDGNWKVIQEDPAWDVHDKGDYSLTELAIASIPSTLQDKLAEKEAEHNRAKKENERLAAEKEALEEAARKARAEAQAESRKRKEAEQDKPWKYTKELIGVLAGLVGIAATIYKLS